MKLDARGMLRSRPGVQASIVVLAASIVSHIGNYLFYIIAAQMVGVARFAEIAAMIALSTIFIWPTNGLQGATARDVARLHTAGDTSGLGGLIRLLLRRCTLGGLVGLAVLSALSPFIEEWLGLSSPVLVIVTGLWIVLNLWLAIGVGVLLGIGAFGRVAVIIAGPLGTLRTLLLPVLLAVLGITGALWAMVAATAIGLGMVARPVHRLMTGAPPRHFAFLPGSAVLTYLFFASVSNLDLVVAKAVLDAHLAGAYSGAALIGKIALYAPAALALVLLPRAAAALERGESARRPLLATLAITALSGLVITAALALLPAGLLSLSFGPGFAAAAGLLAPLALVMTGAALVQVHLVFAIARGTRHFTVLLGAAALAHAVGLSLWHASPGQIVAVTGTVIGAILVIQEVTSEFGAVRSTVAEIRARRGAVSALPGT